MTAYKPTVASSRATPPKPIETNALNRGRANGLFNILLKGATLMI